MAELIVTASPSFELPHLVNRDGTVDSLPAGHLPQLRFPDGSPCVLANLFLLHSRDSGASNHGGTGTLRTTADLLAPLMRWCFDNSKELFDITDNDFEQFVHHLKTEPFERSPTALKRQSNQVTRIGMTALHLLQYVEGIFCERRLLAPEGSIRVTWKTATIQDSDGSERRVTYMTHPHLPPPTATRRRRLISDDAVQRLMVANKNRECSQFIKQRASTLVWTLDITGGRVEEVAHLRVSDIDEALKNGYLTLKTVKRPGGHTTRKIPVSAAELQQLRGYIKMFRSRAVAGRRDEGWLFTDEAGNRVSKQTLSREISKLRKLAGIATEEVVAHAFRHRFLTRKLAEIYAAHGCQTKEELKQLLVSDRAIREEMMEWSGHLTMKSFNRYIHVEFGKNGRLGVDVPSVARSLGAANAMAAGFTEVMAFAADGDADAALARLDQMKEVVSAAAHSRQSK